MKSFPLILVCLLAASSVLGTTPALSDRSKGTIAQAAAQGGFLGLTIASVVSFVKNGYTPMTTQECLGLGAATAAGALAFGLLKYNDTPEKHFSYAKKRIADFSKKAEISMLYQTKAEEWIDKLRNQFCYSPYPLMAAFSATNTHYQEITRIKNSVSIALSMDNADLRQEAFEMMEYANTTLFILKAVMSKITAEPGYLTECSAKAQEDAAQALKIAATAQVIRAVNETYSRNQKSSSNVSN